VSVSDYLGCICDTDRREQTGLGVVFPGGGVAVAARALSTGRMVTNAAHSLAMRNVERALPTRQRELERRAARRIDRDRERLERCMRRAQRRPSVERQLEGLGATPQDQSELDQVLVGVRSVREQADLGQMDRARSALAFATAAAGRVRAPSDRARADRLVSEAEGYITRASRRTPAEHQAGRDRLARRTSSQQEAARRETRRATEEAAGFDWLNPSHWLDPSRILATRNGKIVAATLAAFTVLWIGGRRG
jgi:hypothetical protein